MIGRIGTAPATALALALAVTPIATARAQQKSVERVWSKQPDVVALLDPGGVSGQCGAFYGAGDARIIVHIDENFSFLMAVQNAKAPFRPSLRTPVKIEFPGHAPIEGAGSTPDASSMLFPVGRMPALHDNLTTNATFTVEAPGTKTTVTLAGLKPLLPKIYGCATHHFGGRPVRAAQGEAAARPVNEANIAGLALFHEAGLGNVSQMAERALPAEWRGFAGAWALENIQGSVSPHSAIGWMQAQLAPAGTAPAALVAAARESQRRRCAEPATFQIADLPPAPQKPRAAGFSSVCKATYAETYVLVGEGGPTIHVGFIGRLDRRAELQAWGARLRAAMTRILR